MKLSDVCRSGLYLFLLVMAQINAVAQTPLLSQSASALYHGEPAQAAELARKHLKANPHDARGRVMLARAELALGEFSLAFEDLRQALGDDPRNIDALYYMAIVSKALAQNEYQRLYSIAPDSMRVHLLLAEASLAEGNYTEAESQLKAALAASPRSVEVLTALGELKRSQSKFDEAIDWYQQAERIGPLNYDISYGLGACYTYKQEHSRAIEYFRKALAFSPDSAGARFALGNALFQAGDAEAAIPELTAALKGEPRLKQAYFVLGRAYQKLGREADAKATFSKLDALNRSEAAGTAPKP